MTVIAITTDLTVVIHELSFESRTVYAAGLAGSPEPNPHEADCMVGFFKRPGWAMKDGDTLHAELWFSRHARVKEINTPVNQYTRPTWEIVK